MRTTFALLTLALGAAAAPAADGLKPGTPDVKAVSALAFGPDGVLFVGDPQSAAVFAVATGDTAPAGKSEVNVAKLDQQVAGLLGCSPAEVKVNDVKVNPASGNVYLAVTRAVKGTPPAPVVLKLDRAGKLGLFEMKGVPFAKAALPDLGADADRSPAITSIAYSNGKVIVAGMATDEFASTLRAIPYPFDAAAKPTSVEIFHGAHGKFETRAPVRTFVPYTVDGKEEVVAAYTCTPLVRFEVDALKPGQKVKGTTVAELGNRNTPLDMIVYSKGGKDYLLMANTSRGVMKIAAADLSGATPITTRPKGDKEGVGYETVADLKDVLQLDKLDAGRALLLVKADGGLGLKTVPLP
jgi:hypothetical protein